MSTTLGQRCAVFLDPGGIQRFKIDSSIDEVLIGDLPVYGPAPYTSNIFVHRITAANDPKADEFLRVGNVADLTTLAIGREEAVGKSQTIYLSTEFSVTYDDIATASSAKRLIQQRVDNLIADWHAYNEQFLAPISVAPNLSNIPLPLTLSLETERKDAYNVAHAELLAAKAVTAAAAVTVSSAIDASTAANENAIKAVTDSQQCSTLLGQFNTGKTAVDAYRIAVNTFTTAATVFSAASAAYRAGGAAGTFDTAKTTYDSALTAILAAITAEALIGQPVLTSLQTSMAAACTGKISAVQTAAQKKTEADVEAATATTEKKAADTTESAALIADTLAYLSVKELCPDFTATVP